MGLGIHNPLNGKYFSALFISQYPNQRKMKSSVFMYLNSVHHEAKKCINIEINLNFVRIELH